MAAGGEDWGDFVQDERYLDDISSNINVDDDLVIHSVRSAAASTMTSSDTQTDFTAEEEKAKDEQIMELKGQLALYQAKMIHTIEQLKEQRIAKYREEELQLARNEIAVKDKELLEGRVMLQSERNKVAKQLIENQKLRADKSLQLDEVAELNQQLADKEALIQDAKAAESNMKTELEEARAENAELKRKLQASEDMNNENYRRMEVLEHNLSEKKIEQLQQAERVQESQRNDMVDLSAKLEEREDRIGRLEEQVSTLTKLKDNLSRKCKDLEATAWDLIAELEQAEDRARTNHDALKAELEKERSEHKTCRTALFRMSKEKNDLEKRKLQNCDVAASTSA